MNWNKEGFKSCKNVIIFLFGLNNLFGSLIVRSMSKTLSDGEFGWGGTSVKK